MSQRTRIQNALLAMAKGAEFPVISYDKDSGLAEVREETIRAKTVFCNETDATFGNDGHMGRSDNRRRQTWTFALYLDFAKEVSLEKFEIGLIHPAVHLPPDPESGYSDVRLSLSRSGYSHPVTQQAAGGTSAKLLIEATLGRD